MNKALQNFDACMQTRVKSDAVSTRTYLVYMQILSSFFQYLEEENIDIERVSRADIHRYLSRINDGHPSKSTIAVHIAAIKKLLSYLIREEHPIENKVLTKMQSPKKDKLLPNYLRAEMIDKMLKGDIDTFLKLRNRTIIGFLWTTGLRPIELVNLTLERIDLNDRFIRVKSKRREREVPLLDYTVHEMRRYLREREKFLKAKHEEHDYVFVNRLGTRLTDRGVRKIFKYVIKELDLPFDCSPLTLRHSCATDLMHNGAEIRAIQELLGHASLHTTQIYTHTDISHLLTVYDKYHPHSGRNDEENEDDVQVQPPIETPARFAYAKR